jgi:hypothetical protein
MYLPNQSRSGRIAHQYWRILDAISSSQPNNDIACCPAFTLSSLPDHVARKVVFLSCLSSSCLMNSSPTNSASVSSKGPTEGIPFSPPIISDIYVGRILGVMVQLSKASLFMRFI